MKKNPTIEMLKKNKIVLIAGVVVIVLVVFGLKYFKRHSFSRTGVNNECVTEVVEGKTDDPYMRGLIEPGEEFKLIMGFFSCNKAQHGDWVYYRFSESLAPVPRIIVASPGDEYDMVENSSQNAWNLEVNGDVVKDGNGEPYRIGTLAAKPTLSLYIKERGRGILREGEYLVLSNVSPSLKDSSLLGMANIVDFIAKVEK